MALNEQQPNNENESDALTASRDIAHARVEQERMSRRNVLARFGFKAGAAAVAAMTADDLLRHVGAAMQRRAGDNRVAQQVAEEFQRAGVAFASPSNPCDPGPQHNNCLCCGRQKNACLTGCEAINCNGLTPAQCEAVRANCVTGCRTNYANCCSSYSCSC